MAKPMTATMTAALEHYARRETDPKFSALIPPRTGTVVALIERGLLTAGSENELTDKGRELMGL